MVGEGDHHGIDLIVVDARGQRLEIKHAGR